MEAVHGQNGVQAKLRFAVFGLIWYNKCGMLCIPHLFVKRKLKTYAPICRKAGREGLPPPKEAQPKEEKKKGAAGMRQHLYARA